MLTHGTFTNAARAEPSGRAVRAERAARSEHLGTRSPQRGPGAELFDRTGRRAIPAEARRALPPSARPVLIRQPEPGRTVVLTGQAPRPRDPAAEALLHRPAGDSAD
ncbi:hypothetical protein [Streptomyces sp. NPDC088146]|uniref:hypothetical protein n=1 Tax=Streptomyces sp. NPDC088146 TaxID=3365829 RepID=UPI003802E781